ncbi:MAG TPA: hypothetical protein VFK05_19930 [Polyangiaceae bacterium]|nr:hypothetical protein [Polyangiaceae bacterium]
MNQIAIWLLSGLGAILLWGLLARVRHYGRLLSDAHFQALASRTADLKRAAITRIIGSEADAIYDASDPRVLRTEAGLAVVYTVTLRQAEFVHHYSVSFPGQHVAQGTKALFVQFIARLLGLPLEKIRFDGGAGAVQHAECALSADAHAALVAEPPLDLSPEKLRALRLEAMNARLERRA